jgi:hypothetical protein
VAGAGWADVRTADDVHGRAPAEGRDRVLVHPDSEARRIAEE